MSSITWFNICFVFVSSRRRHTRLQGDWSSDVCSSDLCTIRFCDSHAMESTDSHTFLLTATAGLASITARLVMRVLEIPKSGKCGNTVWQRNRYCQYSYAAFVPFNPRTPAQVTVRGTFGAVSARWRALTQDQRI